jgi:hypothetical protein
LTPNPVPCENGHTWEDVEMRTFLIVIVGLVVTAPGVASAIACGSDHPTLCVINNGSAPPNPQNVIDDATHSSHEVYVRNVGCPPFWPAGLPTNRCNSPGSPTGAEVADGGSAEDVNVYETSTVMVSGGSVGYGVNAYDTSTVTMSGGYVGYEITAYEASTVTMSGGFVDYEITAYDTSTVTMSGGTVDYELEAYGTSTVTMSGGLVGRQLVAGQSGTVTMSGGSVELELEAYDTSTVTMSGGTVDYELRAYDTSAVTMSGGLVKYEDLFAFDTSTVTIKGESFMVDTGSGPEPVEYGDLSAMTGRLTGTLESGDLIDNVFYQGGYAEWPACSGFSPCSGTITLVHALPVITPLISNGEDAETNPAANVIDDETYYGGLYVRNVGCPASAADCPEPWGDATEVVLVAGGEVSRLYARDLSTVTISGGSIEVCLSALDSSTVTMSGGAVGRQLKAYDTSTVTILGMYEESDFAVNRVPVPYGDLTSQSGTLTGTLASGEHIEIDFYQGGYDDRGSLYSGTITLEHVPEPAQTLLYACALTTLALLRRRALRRRDTT